MDQNLHSPQAYDYRQYDQIWQRVAPQLEPYPSSGTQEEGAAQTPAEPMGAAPAATAPQMQIRQEGQLPGAEMNPCCMGSEAQDMLAVITGFIEAELEDRRQYMALARQAPAWGRRELRDLADAAGSHAKRLMAVYYLIMGTCYHPAISCQRICPGQWCSALRERYHGAACNAMNYARAAEGTTDVCLERLFNEMSGEEYHHADLLMSMLERSLRGC